jgi:rhomboid protease GluP
MPRRGYLATPLIIGANVTVFIVMTLAGAGFLQPSNEVLLAWGANFRPLTLDGQWWRLLTSCFLHIGILHLLMNMYALLFVGALLEPFIGTARFTFAYLVAGIAGSTASLMWHDMTVSAGASGAIFGIYGVFLALLLTNVIDVVQRKALLSSIGVFVAYNLLNGLREGIDNAAHIGGLAAGVAMGAAAYPVLHRGERALQSSFLTCAVAAAVLGCAVVAYRTVPNDAGAYHTIMNAFSAREDRALRALRLPPETPRDTLLLELTTHGIDNWNAALALLQEAETLHLPERYRERNKSLVRYCQLRIAMYGLLVKAINERSDRYDGELDRLAGEIKQLVAHYGVDSSAQEQH